MSTNFPTGLDTFPLEADLQDTLQVENHAKLHENLGSAIRALQDKVGLNSSATPNTHDALISARVAKSLYSANSVLRATTSGDPTALTMGPSTILARLATGDIVAATPFEINVLLGLFIGLTVQAWNATLDGMSAVNTTVADKVLYTIGSNAFLSTDFTATGRLLVGADSAAEVRFALGVPSSTDLDAEIATLADAFGDQLLSAVPRTIERDGGGALWTTTATATSFLSDVLTIPAGQATAGCAYVLRVFFQYSNTNASGKTIQFVMSLGGTQVLSRTTPSIAGDPTTRGGVFETMIHFSSVGSSATARTILVRSQMSSPGNTAASLFSQGPEYAGGVSVNSLNDLVLELTGKMPDTAATQTITPRLVELIRYPEGL
jgi:hypothetical protein